MLPTGSIGLVLSLLTSIVIPGLSSLLNVGKLPPNVSALITLALAAVNGFLTEWATSSGPFNWRAAALTALASYVVAALARVQLWAGTRTDAKLLAIGKPPRPAGMPPP